MHGAAMRVLTVAVGLRQERDDQRREVLLLIAHRIPLEAEASTPDALKEIATMSSVGFVRVVLAAEAAVVVDLAEQPAREAARVLLVQPRQVHIGESG